MTDCFGHERLVAYHKGKQFIASQRMLSGKLTRKAAAADHLERAAESMLINIAHSGESETAKERMVYLGYANGSALECAACLDSMAAKSMISHQAIQSDKQLLAEIVRIVIAMHHTAASRVREFPAIYRTRKGNLFNHEDLEAYQVSIQFVGWLDTMIAGATCSTDLQSKLDRSSTAIVLNLAEGCGRFTPADQAKFYDTARKSAMHTATLLDIAGGAEAETGRTTLLRISAMLKGLANAARNRLTPKP
jgi:four helix bundle protein